MLSLPLRVDAIGQAQPIASVQLKTRVDAQIESIAVADGARVKAGDILAKLDSRQVEAQLKQSEAQLLRDRASLELAQRDVQRYGQLLAERAGTQLNLDNAKTAESTARANIAASEAAIDNLKVQLSYFTLRAPISGAIGAFSVKAGNIARANDNALTGVLATINQISPIYVVFSIPQRYLKDLRAAQNSGGAVTLARPQGSAQWEDGRVALIDNAIDAATGMLSVRAQFPNLDEGLWPGQLCDVRVTLRYEDNVVVVPREAIQSGQFGNFVYIADGAIAKKREVKVFREQDGKIAISEGLKVGETVIVGGANMLADGATIKIADDKSGS